MAWAWTPSEEAAVYTQLARGTPYLARDIATAYHQGSLLGPLHGPDRIYYPKALTNAVSRALDSLGKPQSAIMVRQLYSWRPLQTGRTGLVFTSRGTGATPTWKPKT